jgi:hypothetical protein
MFRPVVALERFRHCVLAALHARVAEPSQHNRISFTVKEPFESGLLGAATVSELRKSRLAGGNCRATGRRSEDTESIGSQKRPFSFPGHSSRAAR